MGHQHLGILPGSQKWQQVVQLIAGGADVKDIAAATSAAAEDQMQDASNDPAVQHAVWLMTQFRLLPGRKISPPNCGSWDFGLTIDRA